jgi:hypothetical protein
MSSLACWLLCMTTTCSNTAIRVPPLLQWGDVRLFLLDSLFSRSCSGGKEARGWGKGEMPCYFDEGVNWGKSEGKEVI